MDTKIIFLDNPSGECRYCLRKATLKRKVPSVNQISDTETRYVVPLCNSHYTQVCRANLSTVIELDDFFANKRKRGRKPKSESKSEPIETPLTMLLRLRPYLSEALYNAAVKELGGDVPVKPEMATDPVTEPTVVGHVDSPELCGYQMSELEMKTFGASIFYVTPDNKVISNGEVLDMNQEEFESMLL